MTEHRPSPGREAQQRDAILRLTRQCAAEPSPERVLRIVLEGAVELVEGDDGGIARWDEGRQVLYQVESFLPSSNRGVVLDMARSASGRAVTSRATVVVNDYQREVGAATAAGRSGVRASLAVPLVQEGRLLGVISVSRFDPDRPFGRDDEGAIELLAGIAVAVMVGQAERERAQDAVRASEERFRQIAEAAIDIIWVVDEDCNIVYVNERVEQIGYSPAELIGTNPVDLYAPELREAAHERHRIAVSQALSTGESRNRAVVDLIARDGSRVPFENVTTTLRGDGQPLRRVGVLRDISERRRAEEALRASEERFRQIAEAANDIIWVLDREGRAVYVNPRVEDLGYTPEEILGRPAISLYAPEHVEAARERFRRGMAGVEHTVRAEIELIARDGARHPFESNATTLRDSDGQPAGRVAVLRDIADRRWLEVELRRARDLALQMSEAKSAFLANMSHEIRTPLNGVIGMTGLLLDTLLSDEQREYAEVIRGSAEALLTVINDILDFSKIEADRLELDEQPFDLRDCVESALDLVAGAAAKRGLELTSLVEPTVPETIVGDLARVRQVLLNLLGNAVKFTERGEVVVLVSATPRAEPGAVTLQLSVRDTGIGIPSDRLGRIFDSFTQADTSTARRYGGTGLGLAIARRLSELMGGRMWAESQVGVGSTFHFTIDAHVADAPVRPRPTELLARVAGGSIVIVDDNATNRQLLVRQTEAWGLQPRATARPEEAIEWIASGDPFELAILDVHMPGMDGIELAGRLRQHRDRAALPIVLLSSLGRRPDRAATEHLGIGAFLTKPVRGAHLFETIAALLVGRTPMAPTSPSEAIVTTDLPPLRILLVEDNAVNQKVTLGQLARLGYRADVAANGLEALAALERQRYDLALMDVQMPEMDGLEATRRIVARWPASERPRIVAMTAHALAGDREECLNAGMDDYLSKPIRLSELVDALTRSARPSDGSSPSTERVEEPTDVALDHEQIARIRSEVGDEVLTIMVDGFAQDTPAQLEELEGAIASGNTELVRRLAHTVRGSGGYLGATALVARCRALEEMAREGSLDGAHDLLAAARSAYERFAVALAANHS